MEVITSTNTVASGYQITLESGNTAVIWLEATAGQVIIAMLLLLIFHALVFGFVIYMARQTYT